MSFRARIALAAAGAVAVAVAVLSIATYVIARDVLYGQVDRTLEERANEAVLRNTPAGFVIRLPAGPLGVSGTFAQIVSAAPTDLGPTPEVLPVSQADREVAAGRRPAGHRTIELQGVPVRAYVQQLAPDFAVLVARPLTEVERDARAAPDDPRRDRDRGHRSAPRSSGSSSLGRRSGPCGG